MPASQGKLVADATGDVELDGSTLVIRRIHVVLTLEAAEEHRQTAEKVHGFYAQSCPIYRSIHPQIQVTTELKFR